MLSKQEQIILQAFGDRVRQARMQRRLTQERLAELAGFDRSYISLVERGKRNLSLINICRFAKALETDPCTLFEDIEYASCR